MTDANTKKTLQPVNGSAQPDDCCLPVDVDKNEKASPERQTRPYYEKVPCNENAYEMGIIKPPATPDDEPSKKVCAQKPSAVTNLVPIQDGDMGDEFHPNAPSNVVTMAIDKFDRQVKDLCHQYKTFGKYCLCGVLLLVYGVYFSIAVSKDLKRATGLLVMTVFAVTLVVYRIIARHCGHSIHDAIVQPCFQFCKTRWQILKWVVYIFLIVALLAFAASMGVFHSIAKNPKQLTSAFGIVVFILFSLVLSKRPGWVQWRAVFWGLGLQFLLGVLILRTSAGFASFQWMGNEMSTFLGYSDVGAEFVFSKPLEVHFFVFKVLPTIIFFSYILAMLYYIGVMQWITNIFALVMQYTMGTSGAESLCAAANVFTGMTTAPLVIKPYLKDMTSSELHAVLTSGYATIAGSVLGAYIAFGISASHLLSASIISAPAALAVSKVFYPELGTPKTISGANAYEAKRTEKNIVEAAANGATDGLNICVNVTGQLIAIISTLAFIDAVLSWIGGMVDHPELTFSLICRYVLYPVAWLMGVDSEDCYIVAELVGVKTFLNEFVAYSRLAEYINNRHTGDGPTISVRSEVIATYALCGFSNLGGIAIYVGGISPLVPERVGEVALLSIRALVAGTIACLLTACVAGIRDLSWTHFLLNWRQVRSEVIATYALCGFTNLGGVATYIGGLSPLLPPDRKGEVAILAVKALVAGSVACVMTACVAGVLYDDSGQRFFDSVPDVTTGNISVADIVTNGYV